MDKEKLNKAAELCSDDIFNSYPEEVSDDTLEYECYKAFLYGADWLMQQPLSERLTKAEIAKAKAAYNKAEEDYDSSNDVAYAVSLVVRTVLIEIFGPDLFKEK